MIINKQVAEEVIVEGESNIRKATISADKVSKLQFILTKALYAEPLSACVVESVCNSLDSIIISGKSLIDNPVIVEIGTNKQGGYFFRVSDKGVGLSDYEFENVFMNYLESTKEDDNSQIGAWGLGGKIFLALDKSATFICRKDGVERKYLAYQGPEFCEYDKLYEKNTTEENGVIFEIGIEDRWEKQRFVTAATQKLAYFDTVILLVDGIPVNNTIFRQQDFQWSSNSGTHELSMCLRDVHYQIDWNKLGIPRINIPIALRFEIGNSLVVTPSRENVQYTEKVKKVIIDKIKVVADWFQEKYDEEVKEFDNFVEAFPHLRETDKFVSLGDKQIQLRELEQYMSKNCKGIEVKGLSLQTPHTYFAHLERMCRNFRVIGSIKWNGQYQSKHVYGDLKYAILQKYNGVLLDQHPVGKTKEFLKSKYGRNTYFFLRPQEDLEFYKRALILQAHGKEKWRPLIVELQELHRQIETYFLKDERDVRNSKEFIAWEEDQKAIAKANKAAGIVTNYKTLDKQEGEVTIAYARRPLLGNIPVFEKKTYSIEGLKKLNHILLIFQEEQKEEAKTYYNLHKNLKVAIIGKRERTKLPETHQIMEKDKFEKTKLFKRIVTAMRIEDVLNRWSKITDENDTLVEKCLEKFKKLKGKLHRYKMDNISNLRLGNEERESFMILAKQYSLWDMEILPEVEKLEKALETFYFLEYIEYPRYGTEEDTRRVKRIINQLLLFQKKYGALDNYELVEKPLPDEYM